MMKRMLGLDSEAGAAVRLLPAAKVAIRLMERHFIIE
jgi:hypothetical protein